MGLRKACLSYHGGKVVRLFLLALGVGSAVALLVANLWPTGVRASALSYTLTETTTLLTDGFRPQWSATGEDWIAYDHQEADGYYDVYRIRPDGTDNECLTCDRPEVPRHNGAPNFDPSGQYLVFTAEKVEHGFVPPWSDVTWPGSGIYHDVWALDLGTNNLYRLTDVGSGVAGAPIGGSLHPRFSHDPSNIRLTWSDYENKGSVEARFGNWRIAVADFITTPEPHLENVTYYDPGDRPEWFETQDWTLDDSGVYFACAPLEGQDDYASDFCHLDLATGTLTRLTHTSGLNGEPAEFEEHGDISPLGDAIAFMSSEPYGINTDDNYITWLRTDLWIMNPDGSGKIRLTHFNDPGYPESDPKGNRVMVSKMGWNPDGTQLVASVYYVNKEAKRSDDEPHIKIFHFATGGAPTPTFTSTPTTSTPTPTLTPTPQATATPTPTPASPTDTGWLSPSANAIDSGDGFEIAPENAYTDGSGYAGNINGAGEGHRYYNYGISIPPNASIAGIEVRLDWWLDKVAGANSMCVELSWDGSTSWTGPKCDSQKSTSEHSVSAWELVPTLGGTHGPLRNLGTRTSVSVSLRMATRLTGISSWIGCR